MPTNIANFVYLSKKLDRPGLMLHYTMALISRLCESDVGHPIRTK